MDRCCTRVASSGNDCVLSHRFSQDEEGLSLVYKETFLTFYDLKNLFIFWFNLISTFNPSKVLLKF